MGPGRTAETSGIRIRSVNSEDTRGLLCPFADARRLSMDTGWLFFGLNFLYIGRPLQPITRRIYEESAGRLSHRHSSHRGA